MSKNTRVMKDPRGFLEQDQVNRLINSAKNGRDKLLLILLANTGRRISEALELKPKDIDYARELILWKIEKRKDVSQLWIKTKPALLLALKTYQKRFKISEDGYYFPSTHNRLKRISRQRADQIIKAVGKVAGINSVGGKKLHCHVLRHSFAVWSAQNLKNPADLRLLQMLLAHANIETTAQYLQFAQKEMDKLLKDLPDFLQFGLSDEELKARLINPHEDELDPTRITDGLISSLPSEPNDD